MCGRYVVFTDSQYQEITKIVNEINQKYNNPPMKIGEIFPTNLVPILAGEGSGILPQPMVWGFPQFRGSGVLINSGRKTHLCKAAVDAPLRRSGKRLFRVEERNGRPQDKGVVHVAGTQRALHGGAVERVCRRAAVCHFNHCAERKGKRRP